MIYLFRLFEKVFLGELKVAVPEKTRSMVGVVVVLAILSLIAGFCVRYPIQLTDIATMEMIRWVK
jgi:NADH:ubiquinone oxidoreductase subunit 5 (subunit L)/multisubunit Na+/H+ antiporter MnhA subunit